MPRLCHLNDLRKKYYICHGVQQGSYQVFVHGKGTSLNSCVSKGVSVLSARGYSLFQTLLLCACVSGGTCSGVSKDG